MKIKKIRLKNGYKRFHDLTIDLGENPKRIVALVGPNGCGKSSVLDGILFVFGSVAGQIGSIGGKSQEYHSLYNISNFNYTNVEIEFDIGTFNSTLSDRRQKNTATTMCSFRSPYRYNSNLKIGNIQAVPDIKNNQNGASFTSDLDEKINENYRRLHIKYNDYLEKHDVRPSEARKAIIDELNLSIKNCLNLEIKSIGDIQASKGTIYFSKPDQQKEFEYNVLSSGEKETIDIILDLYLRKEEFTDTIFLLDEPELHINTSIQSKLLIEIDKLIGERCQIWITTHSIGFLKALQENYKDQSQIILFKDDMLLASNEITLKPVVKNLVLWRELFSVALAELSHLVSPKRLIYCEGKHDSKNGAEDGFDAKVYNTIFSEKYFDTQFISSGGNTELDQRSTVAINILSKVYSKIEIFVLKDRDMSSKKIATKEERILYLKSNPANHRLLSRFEIENYLFDAEVLKKYCQSSGLQFDQELYSKVVTDIENNQVKELFYEVKKICNIPFNISQEIFKLNLAAFITEDMPLYKELESCIFY